MSSKNTARRTDADVYFDGEDISRDIHKYMLSITYTDDEEADDLQIRLHDRDNIWLCHWLNNIIEAVASSSPGSAATASSYQTTGTVNVRSGPGTGYSKLGILAYGTYITVSSTSNGWAQTVYSGKTAYVSMQYLKEVTAGGSSDTWVVGDAVIATGTPQYSSYGEGEPGTPVVSYSGNITYLNLKNAIPYPIHVGYLGWFKTNEVVKSGAPVADNPAASTKGLLLQASFLCENWKGKGEYRMLDCGQFELDSVTAAGPPATITIKGTSLSYRSQVRQTKKNRPWEATTLSQIAATIAQQGGMGSIYEASGNPFYKRVEQTSTSDINFLSTLCKDAGLSLKILNNTIVLFDQTEYEAKAPILTVVQGDGSYTKYNLMTGEANAQYSSCRVSYVDPDTGKSIEAIAFAEDYDPKNKNNQQLQVSAKIYSDVEAKTLAIKRLRLHNKFEKNASFTFPGNPSLLAGRTVRLKGWGAWNGKYIISRAVHTLNESGYITQITIRHVLEGY